MVGSTVTPREHLLYEENFNLRQSGFLHGISNVFAFAGYADVLYYEGSGHALESPSGQGNSIIRKDAVNEISGFIRSVNSRRTRASHPSKTQS